MTLQQIRSPRFAIVLVAAALCFANVGQAGPPLICHTIEIGQAKSLPWISHDWNLSGGENYDTKNLVRDTLEILAPSAPVLVRMETLRTRTGALGARISSERGRARSARGFPACRGNPRAERARPRSNGNPSNE